MTRSAADALLGRAGLFRYAVRRPRRPVRRRPRRQGRRRPRIRQRRPRWHDDARERQGAALTGTRDPSAHAPGASPIAIPRFPSIGFTFVFATISPPSIRPVPQSKGRTMATAMKLSVPKPVNLPSMKKVRPRPDALTRNQRSALFFSRNKRRNASAPGGRPALTRDRFHHRRSTPGTIPTRSWFRTPSRGAGPARNPATTREGPRNRRRPPTRRGERSIAPAPRGRRARTRPEPRANTTTVPTPPPRV